MRTIQYESAHIAWREHGENFEGTYWECVSSFNSMSQLFVDLQHAANAWYHACQSSTDCAPGGVVVDRDWLQHAERFRELCEACEENFNLATKNLAAMHLAAENWRGACEQGEWAQLKAVEKGFVAGLAADIMKNVIVRQVQDAAAKELAAALTDLQHAVAKRDEAQRRCEQLSERLARMIQGVGTAQRWAKGVSQQLDTTRAKTTQLEVQLRTEEARVAKLQKELADAIKLANGYQQRLAAERKQVSSVTSQLGPHIRQISVLHAQLAALTTEPEGARDATHNTPVVVYVRQPASGQQQQQPREDNLQQAASGPLHKGQSADRARGAPKTQPPGVEPAVRLGPQPLKQLLGTNPNGSTPNSGPQKAAASDKVQSREGQDPERRPGGVPRVQSQPAVANKHVGGRSPTQLASVASGDVVATPGQLAQQYDALRSLVQTNPSGLSAALGGATRPAKRARVWGQEEQRDGVRGGDPPLPKIARVVVTQATQGVHFSRTPLGGAQQRQVPQARGAVMPQLTAARKVAQGLQAIGSSMLSKKVILTPGTVSTAADPAGGGKNYHPPSSSGFATAPRVLKLTSHASNKGVRAPSPALQEPSSSHPMLPSLPPQQPASGAAANVDAPVVSKLPAGGGSFIRLGALAGGVLSAQPRAGPQAKDGSAAAKGGGQANVGGKRIVLTSSHLQVNRPAEQQPQASKGLPLRQPILLTPRDRSAGAGGTPGRALLSAAVQPAAEDGGTTAGAPVGNTNRAVGASVAGKEGPGALSTAAPAVGPGVLSTAAPAVGPGASAAMLQNPATQRAEVSAGSSEQRAPFAGTPPPAASPRHTWSGWGGQGSTPPHAALTSAPVIASQPATLVTGGSGIESGVQSAGEAAAPHLHCGLQPLATTMPPSSNLTGGGVPPASGGLLGVLPHAAHPTQLRGAVVQTSDMQNRVLRGVLKKVPRVVQTGNPARVALPEGPTKTAAVDAVALDVATPPSVCMTQHEQQSRSAAPSLELSRGYQQQQTAAAGIQSEAAGGLPGARQAQPVLQHATAHSVENGGTSTVAIKAERLPVIDIPIPPPATSGQRADVQPSDTSRGWQPEGAQQRAADTQAPTPQPPATQQISSLPQMMPATQHAALPTGPQPASAQNIAIPTQEAEKNAIPTIAEQLSAKGEAPGDVFIPTGLVRCILRSKQSPLWQQDFPRNEQVSIQQQVDHWFSLVRQVQPQAGAIYEDGSCFTFFAAANFDRLGLSNEQQLEYKVRRGPYRAMDLQAPQSQPVRLRS